MSPLPPELLVLWLAVLLDLVLPEPPNAAHPVAWMGQVIAHLRRHSPTGGRWKPFIAGTAIVVGGCLMCALVGLSLLTLIRVVVFPVSIVVEALVLKLMFSVRALVSAGAAVRRALEADDLSAARRLVSWHLVSRDTARLNHAQVAAAAIESLSENASDSIVAPLLFYALAGLPGVLVYRFINTCDSMLGYRDSEREWLGKFAARLDDLVNFIPARLTAVLLIVASVPIGGVVRAIKVCYRDARVTASPNAGYPMSAAAGALGVELEKCGHYLLGPGERLPVAHDITRAARLVWITTILAIVVISLATMALQSA